MGQFLPILIHCLFICIDEDECCVGTFCDMNATCSNYLGGFNCSCNEGFIGNGTDCEGTFKLISCYFPEYNSII